MGKLTRRAAIWTLTGAWADLQDVRQPEEIGHLRVSSADVGSFRGVGRMTTLHTLTLDGVTGAPLGALDEAPWIENVYLTDCAGVTEWAGLAGLTHLQSLSLCVRVAGDLHQPLREVPWTSFRELAELVLLSSNEAHHDAITADLTFLSDLIGLRDLVLQCVFPSGGSFLSLVELLPAGVRRLQAPLLPADDLRTLDRAMRSRGVEFRPIGSVSQWPPRQAVRPDYEDIRISKTATRTSEPWSVYVRLATLWRCDSTDEAVARLRRLAEARNPGMFAEVEVDAEGSGVAFRAADRRSIETLVELNRAGVEPV